MSADYSDTEKAALDERELIARWLHMHASPTLAKCVRCGVHAGSGAQPQPATELVQRKELDALRKNVADLASSIATSLSDLDSRTAALHERLQSQQRAADTQANAILTDLRAIVARLEKRK